MTGPLTEQAKVLADRVGGLALSVDQLHSRTNRTERVQIFVVLGLLLDLVLSVVAAFLIGNQIAVNHDLQVAQARESKTRQEALCPLYALLLGSYNPSTRAAGPDRDAYEHAFQVMRDGFESLDCNISVVPPRVEPTR